MIDRSLNYGRHIIAEFLADVQPVNSVLDIGAGSGSDLLLARKFNSQCQLFALESCSYNVQMLTASGIKATLANIERDRFPFDDGTIDIVIANQILEHAKDIFWIYHEASRVLKVGGKFIIGVPNLASMHNRLLLLFGRQPSPIQSNSAHVRGFTKVDLIRFVDCCFPGGYQLVNFRGSNFYPFPSSIAKPLARLVPNMAWGIFLLLEKKRSYHQEFLEYPIDNDLETNFYLGQ